MFSKSIFDICLLDGMIVAKRFFALSSKNIEDLISNFAYSGEKLNVDKNIENTKLPPSVLAFYYFLFTKLTIPSEKQFLEIYYDINNISFSGNNICIEGKNYNYESVKGRLLRAYPSLLRDLHFYLLIKEREIFDNVSYSLREDYIEGVDIIIVYKEKQYCISIFIDTARSKFFKNEKEKRHDYSKLTEIKLMVNFETLSKFGNFYLLNENHVEKLITKLNEYEGK